MFDERSPQVRRRVRWLVRGVAVALAIWLLGSAIALWQARSRTLDGLNQLNQVRSQLSPAELLAGSGDQALAQAVQDFDAGHHDATSVVLAPWHLVPLVGQNVRSAAALTLAAARVAATGQRAARAFQRVLHTNPATGSARLALLDQLQAIAVTAQQGLAPLRLGPDFFLVAPLGDARSEFLQRVESLRAAFANVQLVAAGLHQLLQGPHRYLLLAANNAEMRAGSGMLLSASVATFNDGTVSVSPTRPIVDVNLPPGAVAVPPQLASLWGFVNPTQEWRNLATTPRFDETGPLAVRMWAAATGQTVDGVLVVDPVAMRALLAAQGPISAGGQTFDAGDVLQYLLLDQYQGVSIGDPQATRRDAIGAVAQAAVDTLNSRPWTASGLATQLASVGRGRHVLAWARDPVEERAWQAAGIDGALHPESLAVSLLNVAGDKLDQFIHVDASLAVTAASGGAHDATLVLRIENVAPKGLPSYVAGPYPGSGLSADEYQAIVAVNSPGAGSLPRFQGLGPQLVAGIDGPTKASAAGFLRIAAGSGRTVTLRFQLPAGLSHLTVEPSARIPPITWHFGHMTWQDLRPERVAW
jgi:hypothetical protein